MTAIRLLIVGALVTGVLIALHPTAWADECDDSGSASGQGVGVHITCIDRPPPVTDDSATQVLSSTTYSYSPVCVRGAGIRGDGFYGCGGQMECEQNGLVFTVWAHYADGRTENVGTYCSQPGDVPVTQQLTPGDVLRAFRRIPVPASRVVIQPPGGKTLVNLDTVFSTEAVAFSRTVGLLGHRVELAIGPSGFRWVNGDGTEQVTDWPGRSWTRQVSLGELITHRYLDPDAAVRPRVDTTWSARYRVDGGPWRDVGGTVTITGQHYALTVLEASPALVG